MVGAVIARSAALAFSCALAAAPSASAQTQKSPTAVQRAGYVEVSVQPHVTRARMIALEKVRSAECRRLFVEFQDLEGHPLDDVLSAREETPEQHLWRMAFRDGSRDRFCRQKEVFAFTSPGSSTVFVCPRFHNLPQSRAAANVLIHEELHS